MTTLRDLELFIQIAENKSISKAARNLKMLPATASAILKRLEGELKVNLFVRSTRQMRLTQEGKLYLEYCRDALSSLETARNLLSKKSGEVHGHICISATSTFGRNTLRLWLAEFQRMHPAVTINLLLTDRVLDFFQEPVDIALRLGELKDSSLIAIKLFDSRRVLSASPEYLDNFGEPETLEELQNHSLLTFYIGGHVEDQWRFERQGKHYEFKFSGKLCSDDSDTARLWAIDGMGILNKSWIDIADDVNQGRLAVLLNDYYGEAYGLHAVFPQRKNQTAAVSSLINFLKMKASELPPVPSILPA